MILYWYQMIEVKLLSVKLMKILNQMKYKVMLYLLHIYIYKKTRRSILGSDCIDSYFDAMSAL